MDKLTVRTTVEVSMYDVASALCSGMEGGIGYWATITGYREPKALTVTLDKLSAVKFPTLKNEEHVYPHIDYALNEGGGVCLECPEDGDGKKYWLTLAKLRRGLQVMARDYPQHFADLVGCSGDATTGDVLVQCALFWEVVYG